MRSPRLQGGYTFIEVMFFLTISAAMFASVVAVLSLQNRRTAFTESVQTFNQYLVDTMNDVSTGYFPSNSDFSCSLNVSGTPQIDTSNSAVQGQNENCVFAGKVIQFHPNSGNASQDPSKFKTYTLVGARIVRLPGGGERDVNTVEEANIVALGSEDGSATVGEGALSASTRIKSVVYLPGSASISTGGGLAILSGFGQGASSGQVGLKSGNIRSSFSSIPGSGLNQNEADFLSQISNIQTDSISDVSTGILICFQEPGSNGRLASILVGGAGSQNSTEVKFDDNVPGECRS